MFEISAIRKNKISFEDYDFKQDLELRLFLSKLDKNSVSVLEEIIYSSLKTAIDKILKNLEISKIELIKILKNFEKFNLLKIENENIEIDKKIRNFFEFECQRFDKNFKEDLYFVSRLLQKIPIHVLPIWYYLPRSSNNIFNSIIEKFFKTPNLYKRYLDNIEHETPLFTFAIQEIFKSENFTIETKLIKDKFSFTDEELTEALIFLELNFICFVTYVEIDCEYIETATLFTEYKTFLNHLKTFKTIEIKDLDNLIKKRDSDFGFVQDMHFVLESLQKPSEIKSIKDKLKKHISKIDPKIHIANSYLDSVIDKLIKIKYVSFKDNILSKNDSSNEWLLMDNEKKVLHLYYHPLNTFQYENFNEISLKEAEKSISKVINCGYVYFDDFIINSFANVSEERSIELKPFGKSYKYVFPTYNIEEKKFIKSVIFDRLFEAGIVSIGSIKAKDCFRVTKLGKLLFEEV